MPFLAEPLSALTCKGRRIEAYPPRIVGVRLATYQPLLLDQLTSDEHVGRAVTIANS